MNRVVRNTTFAAAVTAALATAFVAVPTEQAQAGGGGAVAAGVIGFATGAIVGGALAQPRYYPAYGPGYYYSGVAAWSPAWYSYCSNRYRSFNPHTGMFVGYDGRYHFCR